jgi:hypothetical protein
MKWIEVAQDYAPDGLLVSIVGYLDSFTNSWVTHWSFYNMRHGSSQFHRPRIVEICSFVSFAFMLLSFLTGWDIC